MILVLLVVAFLAYIALSSLYQTRLEQAGLLTTTIRFKFAFFSFGVGALLTFIYSWTA